VITPTMTAMRVPKSANTPMRRRTSPSGSSTEREAFCKTESSEEKIKPKS
jgi:hypothetical protein